MKPYGTSRQTVRSQQRLEIPVKGGRGRHAQGIVNSQDCCLRAARQVQVDFGRARVLPEHLFEPLDKRWNASTRCDRQAQRPTFCFRQVGRFHVHGDDPQAIFIRALHARSDGHDGVFDERCGHGRVRLREDHGFDGSIQILHRRDGPG